MNEKFRKKAVALKYDPNKNSAPHLIAKGTGEVAENIIHEAKEHHVHIYEDKALVHILDQLELNQQIPEEIYPIIAEVFAFIYKIEHKMREKDYDETT